MPPADGARHMALDHSLLEKAASPRFQPTMRLYRWSPPAISIGRFQPISDIDRRACSGKGIEVVRRPTGGKCILHLDDFTYALILPAGFEVPDKVVDAYAMLCRGILAGLRGMGLEAAIQSRKGEDYARGGGACFAMSTEADLEYNGRKICGSAQLRRGGALLQHGSILLRDRSDLLFELLDFESEEQMASALRDYRLRCTSLEEAGCLLGWDEVSGRFLDGFRSAFGVEIQRGELTREEKAACLKLERAYRSKEWLENADMIPLPREALEPFARAERPGARTGRPSD